ncbi:MAG: replicative DNA helicase [Rhodothermaceae bacterium]|nr:replicative DNA helicase [Rhodothermaceae bacterium]MYD66802.1 replicative DNA helicase [Rhodothermaceae bacterium]MYJ08384.1 replicative DNA helicase [Rhodothermaceae bacterium]
MSEAQQQQSNVYSLNDYSGRVPPQAVELEECVLGACLIDPDGISVAASLLTPDSFYLPKHSMIFRAALTLFEQGTVVDMVLVAERLKADGKMDAAGGYPYLHYLTERVATAQNIEYHAWIVIQKAMARGLIRTMERRIREAYDPTMDPFELLDKAESDLFSISGNMLRQSMRHVGEVWKETMEHVLQIASRADGLSGVPSGFTDLDKITGGWQNTDLIIVAGRPSMGKTAFALACLRNAAMDSMAPVKGVIFSLEMDGRQLMQRMISSEARVDLQRMRRGRGTAEEYSRMGMVEKTLGRGGIWIDDVASMSILELRAKSRRLKAEQDIGLIVVDYLQLLQGHRREDSREQEISSISRSLKALAKELQVPVIALSQLNRNPEDRKDKRPLLSDLRESGAIEQDADLVAFIYRGEAYGVQVDQDGESTSGVAEVIIGKHRNGPTGTVKLTFDKTYATFRNRDPYRSPPPEHEDPF